MFSVFIGLILVAVANAQDFSKNTTDALTVLMEAFGYIRQRNPGVFKCTSSWATMLECVATSPSPVWYLKLESQSNPVMIIPTEIGMLTDLLSLEIIATYNAIIPSEIGLLPKLKKLRIYKAGIGQPLPSSITSNIGLDCLIEIDTGSWPRGCASCEPLGKCAVYPPYPCDSLCSIVKANETIRQYENGPLDVTPLNPWEFSITNTPSGTPTNVPQLPVTGTTNTSAGPKLMSFVGIIVNSITSAFFDNKTGSEDLVSERNASTLTDPGDYTVVYIVFACAAVIIVLIVTVALLVYKAGNRASTQPASAFDEFRSTREEVKFSSSQYNVIPPPRNAYGETTFSNLQ